ncbi:hypothetical protein K7432_012077 [Basidiobolus ranarum]|uniref:FCP1 homology domain-containing protein n=1 Tax=Basidiobolus ranarum TaxID=34480 RepID=A0ABR2VSV6_9FUNG
MAENLITQVSPTQLPLSITTTSDIKKDTSATTSFFSQDKKSPRILKNRLPFSLFKNFEVKKPKNHFSFFTKLVPCVRRAPRQSNKATNEKSPNVKSSEGTKTAGDNEARVSGTKVLLPPLAPEDSGRKCLVLDLDETLVHSSFKFVENADFVVPVEIDGHTHHVYVLKRPGVEEFLQRVGTKFEVVVFTASLSKYADPVMDLLDVHKSVKHRLFRESCHNHRGSYVKDLSQLGRDIRHVLIVDNSPTSYIFHPNNAVPISSWFSDLQDTELLDLIPVLEDLSLADDVMTVLNNAKDPQ